MDIKHDPNAIPDAGAGGRLGELQADEPELRRSSVEPDRRDGDALRPDPSQTGAGAIDGLVGAP
jgi:hypothetical protein